MTDLEDRQQAEIFRLHDLVSRQNERIANLERMLLQLGRGELVLPSSRRPESN